MFKLQGMKVKMLYWMTVRSKNFPGIKAKNYQVLSESDDFLRRFANVFTQIVIITLINVVGICFADQKSEHRFVDWFAFRILKRPETDPIEMLDLKIESSLGHF